MPEPPNFVAYQLADDGSSPQKENNDLPNNLTNEMIQQLSQEAQNVLHHIPEEKEIDDTIWSVEIFLSSHHSSSQIPRCRIFYKDGMIYFIELGSNNEEIKQYGFSLQNLTFYTRKKIL